MEARDTMENNGRTAFPYPLLTRVTERALYPTEMREQTVTSTA